MTLQRLTASGGRSARDLVEGLRLREGVGGRPRVAAVMIASADGRAAVAGRSTPLGHPDDRALLRELRAQADVVLVGTGTLAAERYGSLLDPDQRARRKALGLPEHPPVATISRAMDVPDVPLLHEGVEVLAFTESDRRPPRGVTAVRLERVDLPAVLAELGRRGLLGVTCEGGPGLLREVAAQGCLDDLLLTVAPLLAGGDEPSILAGAALGPVRLRLAEVHRADDHLFLHYRPAA
ncbi:MAG: dihydrofolate reductase family protein [Solirubrobacterales bacterium]|nr:dihydrofolate reductase family protein [Solirubrobacterales bacterium]